MLIEDPFKGAAVPQTIFPRFRRDAAEGRLAVNFDGALIGVCPKDWDDRHLCVAGSGIADIDPFQRGELGIFIS
jgi:hypothetical protein